MAVAAAARSSLVAGRRQNRRPTSLVSGSTAMKRARCVMPYLGLFVRNEINPE
jgi:hypothetical protein